MDRYNGKVAEINTIDPTELPTVLQRLNILKVAIKEAFPMLFAVMTIKQDETANKVKLEVKFIAQITEWEQANELAKDEPVVSVVQFTQLADSYFRKNVGWKKASDRKENNNGRVIECEKMLGVQQRRTYPATVLIMSSNHSQIVFPGPENKRSLEEIILAAVVRLKIISRKEEKETKRKKLNFR